MQACGDAFVACAPGRRSLFGVEKIHSNETALASSWLLLERKEGRVVAGVLLHGKHPGLENVPSFLTAQQCTAHTLKHPAMESSTDAVWCLQVHACRALQWGAVSSHRCIRVSEWHRAPAKSPCQAGRERVSQGWSPSPHSYTGPLKSPCCCQQESYLSQSCRRNSVPLSTRFYLLGMGWGRGVAGTGDPHLRETWSGCRALSSLLHSPAGRRRQSWEHHGLSFPPGLRSSISCMSEGETAVSG